MTQLRVRQAELADRLRTFLEAGPFIVFDPTDEVYLGAEKWPEELLDAQLFHSRRAAEEAVEEHGGGLIKLEIAPYADHDRPTERRLLRDALAALADAGGDGVRDRLAKIIYSWAPAYLSSAAQGPNVWDFEDALRAKQWEAGRAVERAGEIVAALASPDPRQETK